MGTERVKNWFGFLIFTESQNRFENIFKQTEPKSPKNSRIRISSNFRKCLKKWSEFLSCL